MKLFRKNTTFLLLLLFIFMIGENCSSQERVLRTRDGKIIKFEQMIDDIKKVNIIFVGEYHDDRRIHKSQLDILKALQRSGVSPAVGLEMFRTDSQKVLDQWVRGSLGLREFIESYYDNWRIPWPFYRDIFLYSRDNKIPLIGLNVPGEITEKVSRKGFSSLTDEELAELAPGISCNIDPEYMDFIRKAYRVHERGEKSSFVHFCEAQMVWDKTMAWNLVKYIKKNSRRTVIVLAGVGHSWKRGIPEQVVKLSKLTYAVILPEIPDHIDRNAISNQDADYILPE